MRFDVQTAREWARRGIVEAWVHAYLAGGPWANPGLLAGLRLQPRWWRGPDEIPLSHLQRACGPEAEMEYRIDPERWVERTRRLADSIDDPEALPPLIAEYRQGTLSVRDGNHRHEAIRLNGWTTAWTITWFNSKEEWLRYMTEYF